jgi:hypothetical protein
VKVKVMVRMKIVDFGTARFDASRLAGSGQTVLLQRSRTLSTMHIACFFYNFRLPVRRRDSVEPIFWAIQSNRLNRLNQPKHHALCAMPTRRRPFSMQ